MNDKKINYRQIQIDQLFPYEIGPCDVFIIRKSGKLFKTVEKDKPISKTLLNNLQEKGVTYLHIDQDDYYLLISHELEETQKQLEEMLSKISSLSRNQQIAISVTSAKVVKHLIRDVGICENTLSLVNNIVANSLNTLTKISRLGLLLGDMINDEDFITEHSMFIMYVASAILTTTPWNDKKNMRRLSFAAFMHDIYLKDQNMAKINEITDFPLDEYAHDQLVAYRAHPLEAKKLILSEEKIPEDVATIIAHHHEKPDGSGFPNGLISKNTTPLTSVFIVAEHFVIKLFESGFNRSELQKLLIVMSEMYKEGHYKTAFNGLTKAINDITYHDRT